MTSGLCWQGLYSACALLAQGAIAGVGVYDLNDEATTRTYFAKL